MGEYSNELDRIARALEKLAGIPSPWQKDSSFADPFAPTLFIEKDRPFVETNDRVWEHIMRATEGDGDHLLNPEADHTGEDLDG